MSSRLCVPELAIVRACDCHHLHPCCTFPRTNAAAAAGMLRQKGKRMLPPMLMSLVGVLVVAVLERNGQFPRPL